MIKGTIPRGILALLRVAVDPHPPQAVRGLGTPVLIVEPVVAGLVPQPRVTGREKRSKNEKLAMSPAEMATVVNAAVVAIVRVTGRIGQSGTGTVVVTGMVIGSVLGSARRRGVNAKRSVIKITEKGTGREIVSVTEIVTAVTRKTGIAKLEKSGSPWVALRLLHRSLRPVTIELGQTLLAVVTLKTTPWASGVAQ